MQDDVVKGSAAVDGKLQRPITRNFCAELMANTQAVAENNNKKPLAEIVNGIPPKRIAAKKEIVQKRPQKVIEISYDEESKEVQSWVCKGKQNPRQNLMLPPLPPVSVY